MRHVLILSMALAEVASAQSLEQRIASARGNVSFEFTTKPNVCGNGTSINISDDGRTGFRMNSNRSGIHIGRVYAGDSSVCEAAPARALIVHSGATVTDVDVTVGGNIPRADTDLGAVSAADAVRFLISTAPKLESRGADRALMGAAIADGQTPWLDMIGIARNDNASSGARKAALFWVSQEASTRATAGLGDVAMDDDADTRIRSDALFYLAQRKGGEGIPALIKVVNESKSPKLKKDAIFYLSQSRDSRALDLFEKLLSGR